MGHVGQAIASTSVRRVAAVPARVSFLDLPELIFLTATLSLDARDLCQLDRTCRLARTVNRSGIGPWRARGGERFKGVELEKEGKFEAAKVAPLRERQFREIDWKGRYCLFQRELPTFRLPFSGRDITVIENPDEVVYCRCMVPRVVPASEAHVGVYVEIAVNANPDNLSIALVDFEAGGHSSVTFSPDTGAVIRERKIQEVPRKVEGAYVQPLNATSPEEGGFEGSVGIYLRGGHLAFFRKRLPKDAQEPEAKWESTGFITDLSWAEGARVTPCIAFRDEGAYRVRIADVGAVPPFLLGEVPKKYDENRWTPLDWEASEAEEAP